MTDRQRPENELHVMTHSADQICWCQPQQDSDEESVWIYDDRAVA